MFCEGRLVQKKTYNFQKITMFPLHFWDRNQAKTDRKTITKRGVQQKLMKTWSLGPLFGPRDDFWWILGPRRGPKNDPKSDPEIEN